jgi:hypothetical protein
MRLVFFMLTMAGLAYPQGMGVGSGTVGTTAMPTIVPVPYYGFSASAIDHNGNLLVFDVMYSYPAAVPGQPTSVRTPPSVKTRVTVITGDGKKMNPVEYDGSCQVIGTGLHAVYTVVTTTSTSSAGSPTTPLSITTTRRLVALNAVAGVLTASPPSIDVPLRAEVKLALATDNAAADTLSIVDMVPNPMILVPTGATTAPTVQRFAQIIKYIGGAAFDTSIKPIPLQ